MWWHAVCWHFERSMFTCWFLQMPQEWHFLVCIKLIKVRKELIACLLRSSYVSLVMIGFDQVRGPDFEMPCISLVILILPSVKEIVKYRLSYKVTITIFLLCIIFHQLFFLSSVKAVWESNTFARHSLGSIYRKTVFICKLSPFLFLVSVFLLLLDFTKMQVL